MPRLLRQLAPLVLLALPLAGCTLGSKLGEPLPAPLVSAYAPAPQPSGSALDPMIEHYAAVYDVPVALVHRLVKRESGYNPGARNGPYWGLMQIRHDTAITMGYNGTASGLLDAETNLKYAVKYLRGAYLCAGKNQDKAVRLYASGYYYDAKRLGLLEEVGLKG